MILIVEPQCWGDEHVEVNAALLLTVQEAFPGQPITFLAEQSHLAGVTERLRLRKAGFTFNAITIAPRSLSEPRRVRQDAAVVRLVLQYGQDHGVTDLMFCSATSAVIFAVKFYSWRCRDVTVTVILHRNVSSLVSVESYRPWHYLFRLKFALLFPSAGNINYLVYGDHIRSKITQILPRLASRFMAINHPYLFEEGNDTTCMKPEPVTFGFLGTGRLDKGADIFFRLADDFCTYEPPDKGCFILVGYLWDRGLAACVPKNVVISAPDGTMLSRREYEHTAQSVTYAVFCGQAEAYGYFASGALLDAFAFVKPVIALRTPMVEYCFERMGDIGYLCDSYEDMADVVRSLLDGDDVSRYELQCRNIVKNRAIFSPAFVARQLREEYPVAGKGHSA